MAALTSLPMLSPADDPSAAEGASADCREGWRTHSRHRFLLRRGGDRMAAPLAASFAVTDLGLPDLAGVTRKPANRRHMDIRLFHQVAETLFPLVRLVEFKGRGDPLAHPDIVEMLETIADYEPFFRVHTRGPHLSERIVRQLSKMQGELVLVVPDEAAWQHLFREADRVRGRIHLLQSLRDPSRLAVRLAADYSDASFFRWRQDAGFDGMQASPADPLTYLNVPCRSDRAGGHADDVCLAPRQLVHIDLDGSVCGCDRLEARKLGNALTVEAFADCWFGQEYQAFRRRMHRNERAFYDTCRTCIAEHGVS
jgi:MoaA/NifB/PqqE/SkfB family radical SAM enzyme